MIENLSKQITTYYVRHNIAAEKDEIYISYGLQAIFTNIVQLLILLIVALITHTFGEITFFTISYCILRQYIGGGHSKTHLSCVITFTIIAIAASLIASRAHPVLSPAMDIAILLNISVFIVYWRAPVTYIDDRKSLASLDRLKRKGRICVISQTLVLMSLVLLAILPFSYIYSSTFGIFMAGCTLLPLKYFQV